VNGLPTSFKVNKEADVYFLTPEDNPYNSVVPRKIEVKKVNGQVEISGTADQNLVDQITEDFSDLEF
jgi:hypothetical protein